MLWHVSNMTCFPIELLRKKKKVEKENGRLAAQVEELKRRLADLEKSKVIGGHGSPTGEEDVDGSVDSERVRHNTSATQQSLSFD